MSFILRAFSNGMDGVFVGGCRLGECNYITHGNYHALGVVQLCKKLMQQIGLNPERLRIEFMSSGEGILFAEIMNEFGKEIRELGPLGKVEGLDESELKSRLEAAMNIVPYIRLVERERLRVHFNTKEEYEKYFVSEEVDRLFRELIADKYAMSRIILLLREKPLTTREISESLGLNPSEVSKHLKSSTRQGLVKFDESLKRFAPV